MSQQSRPADSSAPGPLRGRSTRSALVVWAAFAAALVFAGWVAMLLQAIPPLPYRLQQDNVTVAVSVLADAVARLAALVAMGALLALVMFSRIDVDSNAPRVRALNRLAGRTGQLWLWSSLLLTFANTAYVNGVPMGYIMRPDAWWEFQVASPSGLAWGASALAGALVVGVSYLARSYAARAIAWVVGALALTFVGVTGNVTVGINHDWATDAAIGISLTMIPLGSAALAVWLKGDDPHEDAAAAARRGLRYHKVVLPLVAVATGFHLLVTWQEMAGQPVTSTWFGVPTVGFYVVLGLLVVSWVVRQLLGEVDPTRTTPSRALASLTRDVVLIVAYEVFRTASNHIAPPRFLDPLNTDTQINYLGYRLDRPHTVELVAGLGRPNILWVTLTVFAVGSYLYGVWLLRRKGEHWPIGRLLFWLAGWGLTLYLAVSGLWEYSTGLYSWHMLVHMTVNMLVPTLCVLGGPFSLLRAASRVRENGMPGFREWSLALDDYKPFQRLLSPPLLWLNYVGSLFLIYFTPLFPWLMRFHWAHQLMLLYFMVTGYVFFNLIVGYDNRSWQLPHLVKLALMISVMPFHAIFAVGILSSQLLIGADFYQTIAVTWVGDLMQDQNIAGQLTWLMGEVPLFVAVVALSAQWFMSDKDTAAKNDARADEDDPMSAYNEMLAQLAQRDQAEQREAKLRDLGLKP